MVQEICCRHQKARAENWGLLSVEWVEKVLFGPPWSRLPSPPIPMFITHRKPDYCSDGEIEQ